MKIGELSNEEAAERRTNLAGWVCKTCRQFYGDAEGAERCARYCCEKDHACGTEGCSTRAERPWIYCEPCKEKRDVERWLALPEVPWDGETPLVLDRDDTYFFSEEDLGDYLEEHGIEIDDVRLVIAVKDTPPTFEMNEFLCDYIPDDNRDVALGSEEIDKTVNKWIEENAPQTWVPGKTRPTQGSLRESFS